MIFFTSPMRMSLWGSVDAPGTPTHLMYHSSALPSHTKTPLFSFSDR